ncbi:hypothetical protein NQ314_003175 [Rhamnusium bicolor]|uniref:RING-CH-type domain-containing protein n=1 Tax=Rhamnusium bicolor TaxID=1586634 RepID=A0AAV8ZP86_9CUCU|nr:hypothetical protein NQ314_003175 [Rhamnusium bicolor]
MTDPSNSPGQRLSIISVACRICYDNDKEEELINPCHCKVIGTVAFVHRTCLETWLGESNTTTCELCHQVFRTERTPKYTSSKSIWRWCRTMPRGAQGVRSDIVACAVITPLAIVITYVCLFSSEYYNQKKFSNVPAARWTSVSLLVMIGIMLIGYYMWVYSVIRMHARMWYNWWQRTCDVRYIPPSTINIAEQQPLVNPFNQTNTQNLNVAESESGTVTSNIEGSTQPQAPAVVRDMNKNDHTFINITESANIDNCSSTRA